MEAKYQTNCDLKRFNQLYQSDEEPGFIQKIFRMDHEDLKLIVGNTHYLFTRHNDKDKDEMTKRPNMCHIFENGMTQGCQI